MDEKTSQYYRSHAAELTKRYDAVVSSVSRYFRVAFTEGARLLDVGAGSGRDMAMLQSMGYDVYGVEPCDEMLAQAEANHPELASRLAIGQLPDLGKPFGGDFDGILCSAVLMHLPREAIFDAAFAMRSALKDGGTILMSVPLNRPGLDNQHRDDHGRLFTDLPPDYLALLFERIGFALVGQWTSDDSLSREGFSWCTLLFRLRSAASSRPADQIEGVLSRDRKTATYKLALFRALSEIATTEFEQARWLDDSTVAVPIQSICDKWLSYYWPIVGSPKFIPQIRGESKECQKPVAFRDELHDLIGYYEFSGGLSRFVLDYRSRSMSAEAQRLSRRALGKIRQTIVTGPVTFAGGALETGRVFNYDAARQEVRMSAGIWRELALLGHWIQEAVILRWAELTEEVSRGSVRVSEIIELLLTTPLPERDVTDARQTYARLAGKECVWTEKPLHGQFAVDHIIPFALWHNNDLWNLVPVLPSVNSQKSDRLPTRSLLLQRRDHIVHYWEALRTDHPARFDFESSRVSGNRATDNNWQSYTFGAIAEAIEVTAVQRGSIRWEP